MTKWAPQLEQNLPRYLAIVEVLAGDILDKIEVRSIIPSPRETMMKTTMWKICPLLLVLALGVSIDAQDETEPTLKDQTAAAPDTTYAPSPAHPFGRPHPDAPAELSQFAFMIGEFDCIDEIRQADGSRLRFRAIWNARYFLNGFGIQDEYWTPSFHTSNIRIFDPASGKWQVTFFRMPGYQSGVWQGAWDGDRMVMRQGGKTSGPGLTFHNITADGFDWHSGGPTPGWTSTCERRR